MTVPAALPFFVSGGTLRADAPSYVERQADHDLLAGLEQGDFCYVLTSRQMGKSSLMIRTAQKLRARGVRVVALDLTAMGQNLTPEQWYAGLLAHVGKQTGREEELDGFWDRHPQLGPCQRFFAGVLELLRPSGDASAADRAWVIFVDEVDAVRSLPFATDEFFAAIRECHNRRAQHAALARLTFCLLGVASPTDLIGDDRTTPFNIGRRIELTDFSENEALPLARGLERRGSLPASRAAAEGQALLRRVLHWTGGHPYLTQRACQELAKANAAAQDEFPDIRTAREVDRLCQGLFLSAQARERDDNLLFVRERLLRSPVDRVALLELYRQVRRRRRVAAADANPLVTTLRLAGMVRVEARGMAVRNRVYAHVFNEAWVRQNLPDAELRRQRDAFWRGVLRTAGLATLILAVVSALGLYALELARENQRRLVRLYKSTGTRRLDQGDVHGALPWFLAAAAHATADPAAARVARLQFQVLLAQAPRLVQLWDHEGRANDADFDATGELFVSAGAGADRSGSEGAAVVWHIHSSQPVCRVTFPRPATAVRFAPQDRTFFTLESGGRLALWDVDHPTHRWFVPHISDAVFSLDGATVITATRDGHLRWFGTRSGQVERELPFTPDAGTFAERSQLALSPDGARLAVARASGTLQWLDLVTGAWQRLAEDAGSTIRALSFSRDGQFLAAAGTDKDVRLWSAANAWKAPRVMEHMSWVHAVGFSPTAPLLLSSSSDMTARLWHLEPPAGDAEEPGRPACSPMRHQHAIRFAEFSPDGRYVVTASFDGTARVWDGTTGESFTSPLNHFDNVVRARFAPDSRRLATVGAKGVIKLWELPHELESQELAGRDPSRSIAGIRFDPTGKYLLTWEARGTAVIWDTATGAAMCQVNHPQSINDATFSPDGAWFATVADESRPGLWVTRTGERVVTFTGGPIQCALISVAFHPAGRRLATGDTNGCVVVWDCATGRPEQGAPLVLAQRDQITPPWVLNLAYDPTGRMLAAGTYGRQLQLWDTHSGACLSSDCWHPTSAEHVTFSPDGRRLVVSQRDDSLEPASAVVYDVGPPLKKAGELSHYDGVIMSAFSPDGHLIATASEDGTAKLWDAVTLEAVSAPLAGGYQVRSVAFSTDLPILLTLAGRGKLRLWDTRDAEPLTLPFPSPSPSAEGPPIHSADLSPDGTLVAVGTREGAVHLWRLGVSTDSLETLAGRVEAAAGYRLDTHRVPVALDIETLKAVWSKQGRQERRRAPGNVEARSR